MLPFLLVMLGATLLLVFFGWLLKVEAAIGRVEKRLAVESLKKEPTLLPEQEEQLQILETRFVRVIGASVDAKLRTLERSVERGSLAPEDLRLMEDITGEIRFLRAHRAELSEIAPPMLDAPEHPRFQPVASEAPEAQGVDLLHEIARLRTLFYALAIGLGVAAMGLASAYRRRNRLIESASRQQLPIIRTLQKNQRH